MTSGAEDPAPTSGRWSRRASLDEQARAKSTRPIGDGSFYVREELFAEPGELEEFLEHSVGERIASLIRTCVILSAIE